jgi:hypothetical protein
MSARRRPVNQTDIRLACLEEERKGAVDAPAGGLTKDQSTACLSDVDSKRTFRRQTELPFPGSDNSPLSATLSRPRAATPPWHLLGRLHPLVAGGDRAPQRELA